MSVTQPGPEPGCRFECDDPAWEAWSSVAAGIRPHCDLWRWPNLRSILSRNGASKVPGDGSPERRLARIDPVLGGRGDSHMRRVLGTGRAKLGLAVAAIVSLVVGATFLAQPSASASAAASTRAAASKELARIRQGLLSPGVRAPSPVQRVGALTQIQYYNWSGYADDNSAGGTYTKVSGSWTQPAVTCPAKEDEVAVFWVGLDGFSNSTVEQDGTLAQCYQGTAYYYTWWEMYPTNDITTVGSTVVPGDHIAASASFASGKYTLKLTDSTTAGNSFSMSETCGAGLTCANASAEWIAETPSYARGYAPLPNFKTWKVSSAKATRSGTAGVISTFPDDQITMVGVFGENLAKPGALNATGNGFGDTWAYAW